jgi:DNA-binding NarL/FixJ family response regulator
MTLISSPIIIAKADGKLREGLYSLLENQPSVRTIDVIQDEISLFQKIKQLSSDCIILLDIDLFEKNTFNIFNHLQADYPYTKCILLVNTFNQKKLAFSAGFYNVLIKGFNANDLLALIQQVQTPKSVKNNVAESSHGIRA